MLLFELSLAHIVEGLIRGPSGEPWKVAWNAPRPHPDRDGKFERCTRFDGQTAKITVMGVACPRRFTFAAWVRCGPLVHFHYAAIIGFGMDRPFFGFHRGRPLLLGSVVSNKVVDAAWTHIAVAQDGSRSRMYVNGVLVASSISVALTGGTDLAIGCDLTRGYAWFEGEMAQVMLFDEALGEAELQPIMRSGRADLPQKSPPVADTLPPQPQRSPPVADPPRPQPQKRPPVITVPPAPPPRSAPARGPASVQRGAGSVDRIPLDQEIRVTVPIESEPPITIEIPVIVSEVLELETAAPTSTQLHWASHLPFLESLLGVFSSIALGDIITALRAGLLPSSSDGCRVSGWSPTEGGSIIADLEPLRIEAGSVLVLEIGGVEGDPPALWLQLAPRIADAAPEARAWLRASVRLLAGAVTAVIEREVSGDGRLLLTLVGGAFGDAAETTVELSPGRRCKLTCNGYFGYSGQIGSCSIQARVAAAMVVSVDGAVHDQQIEFSLDVAGEWMSFSASPAELIVSADGLRRVFEDALRAKLWRDGRAAAREGDAARKSPLQRIGQLLTPATAPFLRGRGR